MYKNDIMNEQSGQLTSDGDTGSTYLMGLGYLLLRAKAYLC